MCNTLFGRRYYRLNNMEHLLWTYGLRHLNQLVWDLIYSPKWYKSQKDKDLTIVIREPDGRVTVNDETQILDTMQG